MSLVIKKILNNLKNIADGNKIITGQEVATNEYIDGKRVYRKRINCGNLPNATSKTVSLSLSNVNIIKIEGIAKNSSDASNNLPLPYMDPRNLQTCVMLSIISGYNIALVTAEDKSYYTAYVTVYYTKN